MKRSRHGDGMVVFYWLFVFTIVEVLRECLVVARSPGELHNGDRREIMIWCSSDCLQQMCPRHRLSDHPKESREKDRDEREKGRKKDFHTSHYTPTPPPPPHTHTHTKKPQTQEAITQTEAQVKQKYIHGGGGGGCKNDTWSFRWSIVYTLVSELKPKVRNFVCFE